ncbi:MAG: hypothetical protein ACI3ZL_04890 [Candidatus Cryptobacteroides sp.]
MKKNIVVLIMAGAVALAGCQKEVPAVAPEFNEIVITAVADSQDATKTILDGVDVLWNNGDAIAVYNGTAVAEFVTALEANSTTADFTTENSEFQAAESYLAVYPYSAVASFADGKATVTVPATQTAKAGTFATGENVSVATGPATALAFKNVCGYLKFTVPAGMDDLTKVVLAANGENEYLAGKVEVSCSDASYTVNDGATSVSLEGTFVAGQSYYMAVLPQTLASGFTLTMTRGETTSTMKTSKSFTFTRSRAASIGDLYDGTWKVALEGTAVPDGAVMTNCGNGYCSFRGNLSAGDLKMRVLYENTDLGTVSIPSDGWYHILLDTETKDYKIYTQDVFVDFGTTYVTSQPWYNIQDVSGSFNPTDYNGTSTDISISLGEGIFSIFTPSSCDTSRGTYKYMDDEINLMVWSDAITFGGTKGNGNVGPKQIVLSGLDSGAKYEIRIVSTRFGGSISARIVDFYVVGLETSSSKQIKSGIAFESGNSNKYLNYESVPFEDFVARFCDCQPTEEGNLTLNVTAIDTGAACDAHVNAIQIFKQLK